MKKKSNLKITELKIVRHKTPKHIISEWGILNSKAPLDMIIKMGPFSDKETGTLREAISILKGVGRWGFCRYSQDGDPAEIHFWADPECHIYNIAHIFGHEMAHLAGYKSEEDADKIGHIASFAMTLCNRHYKNKIKILK